jgi:hypothetical protein
MSFITLLISASPDNNTLFPSNLYLTKDCRLPSQSLTLTGYEPKRWPQRNRRAIPESEELHQRHHESTSYTSSFWSWWDWIQRKANRRARSFNFAILNSIPEEKFLLQFLLGLPSIVAIFSEDNYSSILRLTWPMMEAKNKTTQHL